MELRKQHRMSKQTATTASTDPNLQAPPIQAMAQRAGRFSVFILMIGIAAGIAFDFGARHGYAEAYREFMGNRYSYSDVVVTRRYSEKHFQIQPARMQPFDFTSCTALDWRENEKMRLLRFQPDVEHDCKDVALRGEFYFYTDQSGNRIQEVADGR
jgi:hypothetical protein